MQSPPRRRNGRTKRTRLRASVFLLLAGITLGIGLAKLSPSIALLSQQQKQLARLRAEKAALTSERTHLNSQKQHLATAAGQETTARRRGYVREGERRLMFVREDRAAPPRPQEDTTDHSP